MQDLQWFLLATILVTARVTALAHRNPISFEHYQTAKSTDEVQAHGCGTTSDQLCDVCIQFAVKAINVLLNIILGEYRCPVMHVVRISVVLIGLQFLTPVIENVILPYWG